MKSSFDTLAASLWTRPSARPAHAFASVLRVLAIALIAAFAALAPLAPRAEAAGNPTVYSFSGVGADGDTPRSPLTVDGNGNLWGTTYYGGTNGTGCIYEFLHGKTTPTIVYSFSSAGTSDGKNPFGGLCLGRDGNFYGTCYYGGSQNYGTFYQVKPTTGAFVKLYDFLGSAGSPYVNPEEPIGTPVQGPTGDNNFYFCSVYGGRYTNGCVVGMTTDGTPGGTSMNSYSFGKFTGAPAATKDGNTPYCTLCLGRDGVLYGTTLNGGTGTDGTMFAMPRSLNPASRPTINSINNVDTILQYPYGGVVQGIGADTALYGTAYYGSTASSYGGVWKINTDGTGYTLLYNFVNTNNYGGEPYASLTIGSDGKLYGVAKYTSGTSGNGVVFRMPTTGTAGNPVVYTFTSASPDGQTPYTALMQALDGYFYGTTQAGGSGSLGTLFRFGPPTTYATTVFTPKNTVANLSLAWSDVNYDSSLANTENGYSITSPTANGGTVSAPLSGSTVPASPIARTYTPASGYIGVDTFNYKVSNSLYGYSPTTSTVGTTSNGLVTAYVGSITANASPNPVTGNTTMLIAGGEFPTGADTTLKYTWAATTLPSGAPAVTYTGSANGTNAANAGVIAKFYKAGTYVFTLTVTAPDGTTLTPAPTVTVVVNQTLAAGSLTITPSAASVGAMGTVSLSASGLDQFNNAITTFNTASTPALTWSAPAGSFNTTTSNPTTYTAPASGVTTVTATSGAQTATSTITVTTPTITANTPTYTVTGATVKLTETATVTPSETLSYAWSCSPSIGAISSVYNPSVTIPAAGTYVFQVIVSGAGASSVTKTVSVTVAATAATVVVTPYYPSGAPTGLEQGMSLTFSAVVNDQFGNALASQPAISWSSADSVSPISGPSTTLTGTPGTGTGYKVTATDNADSLSGVSYYNDYNDAPTITAAALATPNPVNGTSTSLSVTAQWRINGSTANLAPESYLTYTWSEKASDPYKASPSANGTNAAKNITATFPHAGTYNLYVTVSTPSGLTATSPATGYLVVVVNSVPAGITITPPTSSLDPNSTQSLMASEVDQFGTAVASQPGFSWSVADSGGAASYFTSPGNFTAAGNPVTLTTGATNGTATVTVTGGSFTAMATYTIQLTPPTVVNAAAANGVTGTYTDSAGDTQVELTALGSYNGNASNLTYTWSYTGPGGVTYSSTTNGTNAAKDIFANFTQAGTYVFTVTIKAPSGLTATSSVTVILQAIPASIVVTPAAPNGNPIDIYIGNSLQYTAVEIDQFGNTVASHPAFTWHAHAGSMNAVTGLYTAIYSLGLGVDWIWATDGTGLRSVNSYNDTINTPTLSTTASYATSPNPVTTTSTTLIATPTWGGPAGDLTYTWTKTSGPAVTFGSANGTNAGQNLSVTFTAAGSYTFLVTVTSPVYPHIIGGGNNRADTATASVTIQVNSTPTTVTVMANPSSIAIGAATSALTATVKDQFNAILTGQTFAWSISSSTPVVAGQTVGTLNSASSTGTNTFNPTNPGTATVQATDGTASGTATVTVTDVAPTLGSITVSPNPVTGVSAQFAVTGNYGGSGPLTYVWSSTAGPASVAFAGGTSGSPGSPATSVGTFTQAGSYTVKVVVTAPSGASASSTITFTVNQTYTSVTVTPNPVSVPVGGGQQFTATAKDQFGAALTTQPGFTWSVVNSGGAAGTVDTNGLLAAGGVPGTAVVKAVSGAYSDTSQVTITDVAPTLGAITYAPNPVNTVTAAVTVTGTYAGTGNLTYIWSQVSGPSTTAFSGGTSGASGAPVTTTATFNAIGTYVLQVRVASPSGDMTATGTVTVNVIAKTYKVIINESPASVALNGTINLTATAYDQFGIAMATQPSFTWSVTAGAASGSIGASSGIFTASGTAGTATVQVVGSSVSGTGTVQVINQPPTVATDASANPNPVTTGTTSNLTVLGAYVGTGGEGSLIYTWSAVAGPATPGFSPNGTNAAKNSVVTFPKAGTYQLRVTITDPAMGTTSSDVTVVVQQTLTTIKVTPGPTDTEQIGGTQNFTATGYGQFGNPMAVPPTFTWTSSNGAVGSINSGTGVFTIGTTPGTTTITATSAGVSGTSVVTVVDVAPTVGTSATASPSPVTGTTTNLSVLGQYVGGESALKYTWAASGSGPVSFSDNGDNTAKNCTVTFTQAGTYTFTATIADAFGGSVTSAVSVLVYGTKTSITVTPNPANVAILGTQTFTGTLYDQFGHPITGIALNWSVKNGVGTITSGGVYTAGTVPGAETVEASTAGATGDATVNVTDAPPTLGTLTASPNPVTATTTNLTVTGTYSGTGSLSYSWSATGPAPVNFSGGTSGASGSPVTSTATFGAAGTYTIKVIVSDIYGGSSTQTTTVTVNQMLTAISVAPTPVNVPIGGTQTFTGVATDQFGAAMAAQPTFTYSVTGGGAINSSTGLYTAPTTPGGTATITGAITSPSLTATATAYIVDVNPTVATAASATPNPVTGTTTSLSVLGAYVGGSGSLTYTWSATGPAPVTFSVNGTNGSRNTVATFQQEGVYTFNVAITDPSQNVAGSSVTVTVNQSGGPITLTPSPASVGIGGTQSFNATQTDQFGNALDTQPTFTYSVTSGGGTVDAIGDYTAPLTPGTAVVKAVSSGGGSATVTITITDATPTVVTAASASPNPVTGTTTNLSALGAYVGGESSLTYTWSATGPASVAYSVNGTNVSKNAIATFTKPGTYTFTVTIADPSGTSTTSVVTVSVVQTLTTLNASPKTATINIGGTQQFTVATLDQFGAAMTVPVTWTVTSGNGTVSASGLFTATLVPGVSTVTASSNGLSDPGQVTVNDTPVTVATAASASPSPATSTTTALSVLGAYGGGEGTLTYTWAVTSGPSGATFSDNGDNAAKNVTATFTQAGAYTFTVTIADAYGASTTSSVNVTVNRTQTTVAVTPSTAAINVGGTKQLTATAYDQFGIALTTQPTFTWAVTSGPGSVSASGLYTASATAGTATVQAAANSQSDTSTITVADVAPTVATVAKATPNPVTGTTTALSVLGAYAAGESNLTYTWSLTSGPAAATYSANGTNAAKNATATFTQAGSYVFLVTISTPGGLTATSGVTVTVNQTPTTFTVTPATAIVVVNGLQQIAATLQDQFGNAVTPAPTITWTIMSGGGTVSTSGLFTAPNAAGTTVVKATSGTYSGTSTLTINDGPPSIATVAAATPNPVTGTTTALSVLGAYIGGENTLTYTWSATGPAAVTYSINGTNAAKNTTATFTKAGTYTFTVTLTTPSGYTATNTVMVTVNQTPTAITVTPNPGSIGTGGTLQMTATSKDQFGSAISPSPTFTWTVTSGGGTISASGLYTAPGTTGTATVKATSGTASGTATINIVNAGSLTGTVSTSSAGVNLTTEGTLDWTHWGRSVPGLDRKSTGNLISAYTALGGGSIGFYRSDPRLLSWTNGSPTASSSSNPTGVYSTGIGTGFMVSIPAISTTRTAVVYVGGDIAGGTMTATLSDGSVATFTNVQPAKAGLWDAEYTFTFASGTPSATLNVSWVQSTSGTGNVTLSAVTLH